MSFRPIDMFVSFSLYTEDGRIFELPGIVAMLILLGLLRAKRPALTANVPRLRREVIRVLSHAKPRPGPGNRPERSSPGLYRSE